MGATRMDRYAQWTSTGTALTCPAGYRIPWHPRRRRIPAFRASSLAAGRSCPSLAVRLPPAMRAVVTLSDLVSARSGFFFAVGGIPARERMQVLGHGIATAPGIGGGTTTDRPVGPRMAGCWVLASSARSDLSHAVESGCDGDIRAAGLRRLKRPSLRHGRFSWPWVAERRSSPYGNPGQQARCRTQGPVRVPRRCQRRR